MLVHTLASFANLMGEVIAYSLPGNHYGTILLCRFEVDFSVPPTTSLPLCLSVCACVPSQMCSPEPGKGGGGSRGSRGGRRNNGGGISGVGGGGLGGLSEFWSCLDPKQRDSLLTINGRAVRDALDCELCRDLVSSATFALEEGVWVVAAVDDGRIPQEIDRPGPRRSNAGRFTCRTRDFTRLGTSS